MTMHASVYRFEREFVKNAQGFLAKVRARVVQDDIGIAQITRVGDHFFFLLKNKPIGLHPLDVQVCGIDRFQAGKGLKRKKFNIFFRMNQSVADKFVKLIFESLGGNQNFGFARGLTKILMVENGRIQATHMIIMKVGNKNIINMIGEPGFAECGVNSVATVNQDILPLKSNPGG